MIRRPPRSTLSSSSAASDVYKRQLKEVAKVLNFVHKIKEAGKACIYITHAMADVYEISDRFAIMDRGEIVADIAKKDISLKALDEFLLEYSHGMKDKVKL